MKRKIVAMVLTVAMVCTMTGCGKKTNSEMTQDSVEQSVEDEENTETKTDEVDVKEAGATNNIDASDIKQLERPSLLKSIDLKLYDASIVPSIPAYSVEPDWSNVLNSDKINYCPDAYKEKLAKNLFVVGSESGREFYETYEYNSYSQTPNFVTVDSMMHTYHLYFAHLLKTTEKSYLSDALKRLSLNMFDTCVKQYDDFCSTEWEEAAIRNVEYFAVASKLIGNDVDVPDYARDAVAAELDKIMAADSVDDSRIVDNFEDYSQYKPRGYYEGDEQLEKYFRTMMWYGRINFAADKDSELRSAMLMTKALDEVGDKDWEAIYAVTSFFAGASDDMGYCEYLPILESVYGKVPGKEDMIGDNVSWSNVTEMVALLEPPKIQSIPVYEDEESVIPGFRFMGQRFTIDASIMQNLIYRAVGENADGEKRMLPTVLDVPAALGSDVAKELALSKGADKYPDYEKNLDKLRGSLDSSDESLWNASLYSQWLNTLRPLLEEKGEGYPLFMQSKEWSKKTIETFAGSYTELKHDTILYGKQPMAEMGGGDLDPIDDRGYVEPEPLVFARFSSLASATGEGLKSYGMINKEDEKNLDLLSQLADKLLVISQKELKNEVLDDDEYELIRNYGGDIEHFWHEALKYEDDDKYFTAEEYPAALVVDVATDPNGTVLEAGTGNPREIAVIVPVDGILRIAVGSVYNFYEFEQPLSDRLTDSEWRLMIGATYGDDYSYARDDSMDNPEWTKSYREEQYDYSSWY